MLPTIVLPAPHCSLTTNPTTTSLRSLRDRLLYPDLKAQAIAQAKKHRPDVILIEEAGLLGRTADKGSQSRRFQAIGVIPEGDKLTRVSIQLEKFANSQVFFPREAPWLVDFENELFAFPNGRYDDQVDALIQAFAYKRPTPLWNDAALRGFGEFHRQAYSVTRLLAGLKTPEIAVNLPSIACFALRNSLFHGEQGITA